MIHDTESEAGHLLAMKTLILRWFSTFKVPLDFHLKNDIRKHITCLSLELGFRKFYSQSRNKKKKLLNFGELMILQPSIL